MKWSIQLFEQLLKTLLLAAIANGLNPEDVQKVSIDIINDTVDA